MNIDPSVLITFPVFVLSIVVHECAHGLVALWNGDPTARERGRLTLNPLPHVDPIGSLVLPGILLLTHAPFLFGWRSRSRSWRPICATLRTTGSRWRSQVQRRICCWRWFSPPWLAWHPRRDSGRRCG